MLESLGHTIETSHPEVRDDSRITKHFVTTWAAGQAWTVDHWARIVGRQPGESESASVANMQRAFVTTTPESVPAR